MNILHLTDLHLDNSNGINEALRSGFFKEYLHDLLEYAKQYKVGKVFITGDIVNCYKTDNYIQAKNIVAHICETLKLTNNDIFVINGNHDLDYKSGCKKEYEQFVQCIDNEKELLDSHSRYSIFKTNNDIFLCLDSIGDNYETGYPECITEQADQIIRTISDNDYENIFVLSHHPAISKDVADYVVTEEENWHKKHLWHSGNILLKRLSNPAVNKKNIFWFSGDIHLPEHTVIDESQIHFTTGSLYLIAGSNDGKIHPQARLFSSNNIESSQLCTYQIKNFKGTSLLGNWKKEDINAVIQKTSPKKIAVVEKQQEPITHYDFQLLSPELEREIYNCVKTEKLCKFGNFKEKTGYTSLSWVSVTGLFQDQGIYSQVILKFRKKIKSIIDCSEYDCGDYIIVGIDNWGAIMASRLGAATNINSCSIAIGNNNSSHLEEEVVNDKLKNILSSKKGVILLTDVISTGRTLADILGNLDISENVSTFIFSIFFDNNQEHPVSFEKYMHLYAACTSVRLPIIQSSKLFES